VLYNFEVVRDDSVILTETIHLPHISHAWPAINRLASMRHHVAIATALDVFCEFDHVLYMFYRTRRLPWRNIFPYPQPLVR